MLIARSKDKLEALAAKLKVKHHITVTIIVENPSQADLAYPISLKTQELGIQVDVLINNTRFGGHGLFHQSELTRPRD